MKACVAERFIHTLKNKIFKQFTDKGTYNWINTLPDLIKQYNETVHSTIKMKPV